MTPVIINEIPHRQVLCNLMLDNHGVVDEIAEEIINGVSVYLFYFWHISLRHQLQWNIFRRFKVK